jgi:hypothetical protein
MVSLLADVPVCLSPLHVPKQPTNEQTNERMNLRTFFSPLKWAFFGLSVVCFLPIMHALLVTIPEEAKKIDPTLAG